MASLHARGCRALLEDTAIVELGNARGIHALEMPGVVVNSFVEAVFVRWGKVKGAEALGEVGGLAGGEVNENHAGWGGQW